MRFQALLNTNAGALVAVDNTFLSPALQQPLALGADIVFHSTTKYINGHSDVVGGVLVTKEQALGEKLAWWANCIGITGSAFDSFLALRGLKTLPIRMKQHEENAEKVAEFLKEHNADTSVLFFWGGALAFTYVSKGCYPKRRSDHRVIFFNLEH